VQIPTQRPAIPTGIFRAFLQSLQANPWIVPCIRPRPLPSLFFLIHYSLRWMSSGLLRRVVWQKFTDVLEVLVVSSDDGGSKHL
jgi:hypothetical protein